jgi:phosphoglycolate phosphatase-like HAD superfamily hydrolase
VPKLVLFDIDGTLLRAYGAGSRAMRRAAETLLGERCKGAQINFGGALDPWIFRQLAAHGGYHVDDARHTALRALYGALLVEELALADPPCQALPGVLDLLARMREERRATLGLLTGNYAETAALKLRAAGIDPSWFSIAAWGDMAGERHALVPVALSQAPERVGAEDVIVVGDTVRDVHCARANGSTCVAVATGGSSERELREAGAHVVLRDLRDAGPLLQLLS